MRRTVCILAEEVIQQEQESNIQWTNSLKPN